MKWMLVVIVLQACTFERSCIASCERCEKVTLECYTKGDIRSDTGEKR